MMKPKHARQPPIAPKGIAAGRPMTVNAVARLALEAGALRPLAPPVGKLTSVFARLYFFRTSRYSEQPLEPTWQRFRSPSQGENLVVAQGRWSEKSVFHPQVEHLVTHSLETFGIIMNY